LIWGFLKDDDNFGLCVLKLEISCYRVMISWRIWILGFLLEDVFEDYVLAWWNIFIWVSIILLLLLPLRYFFNVNGKATLWHTPLVFLHKERMRMDLLTFEGFSGFPLGKSTVSLGIPSSNSFLHVYYYYCVWVKPRSRAIFSNKRSSKILTPWVHQHPLWYRWKIPKIHLNYFSLLQIFRA
jgi:hypothetical protein